MNEIDIELAGGVTHNRFLHQTYGHPCFRNVKPSNTRRLRYAKAGVISGQRRGTIAFVGNSTVATASATLAAGRRRTYPRRVAEMLNCASLPTQEVALFGYAGLLEANYRQYEDRLTMSAEWAGTSLGPGGAYYNLPNGAGAGSFAFTPGIPFDTIEMWVIAQSGRAVFNVDVDGGTPTSINTGTGTFGVRKETLNVALGEHTINISRTGGGIGSILAIIPINSTKSVLDIYNLGISGARAATFDQTTQGYNPGNSIPLLAPDAIFYELGINNAIDQTDLTAFKNDVQGFVDKNIANSDIIMVTSEPQAVSSVPFATQMLYETAKLEIAAANDLPVIDMRETLETQEQWASTTSRPVYIDERHTNEIGAVLRAFLPSRAIQWA